MSKSKEFDNILNECLERLLVKGETVAQCLQSFPEQADELKPLLEMALATRRASAIQPRPEFRAQARYQFSSALQKKMETKKSHLSFSWHWQPQWVTVVAIVLVLLLASGGTVAAASGSMPDEPLYPVKLASEQVRLVFTPSALGKAEFYADLADRRVEEIARMAGKNKPEQIERTSRRLSAYLAKVADLASPQAVMGGAAMAPAAREAPAPREALAVEESLVQTERARGTEEAPVLAERARGAEETGFKGDRKARLRATVKRHAINHPARLRALLKTVPPSAREALLQAIDLSETGYEKASKSVEDP
ncbi:MAG: hypothetical protein HY663_06040 [Chloroflexi bacterium]|nr:hypothetical protein [Chloroflexota bacterium]